MPTGRPVGPTLIIKLTRIFLCESKSTVVHNHNIKKRTASAQVTRIQLQNWRNSVSCVPQMCTSHSKSTVLDLVNVCINHAPFKLQWTRIFNKECCLWFWYTCDLEMRSRSSNLVWIATPQARLLSHKDWKTPLNNVRQKANDKSNHNVQLLSLLNMCKDEI